MTKQRELAELRSLFGQSAIDDATARWNEAKNWAYLHPQEVAQASRELQSKLHNPPEAVAYAASLEPQLRAALIIAILES